MTSKFSRIKSFRPNRTVIVFGLALIVGVVAALIAASYLRQRMQEIENSQRGNLVQRIVAKVALVPGDVMGPEKLAIRSIPKDYAHANGLKPEDFSQVEGRSIGVNVEPGEAILPSMLSVKKVVQSFSTSIVDGRRAMTLPVDEINSISGMLSPGDSVDLYLTIKGDKQTQIFPILSRLQVLATGQQTQVEGIGDGNGTRRTFATITVNTTPEQAQEMILAREVGKITAVLRNPGDHTPLQGLNPKWRLAFQPAANSGKTSLGQVPVLYGGSGNFPPEALQLGRMVPEGANANLIPGKSNSSTPFDAVAAGNK